MKQAQMAVAEIERGQVRPVYLVHGEESWLVFRARQRLVGALERQGGIVQRYAPEADVEQVLGELQTLSLFAERRVVVWPDCPHLARGSGDAAKRRLLEALDAGVDPASAVLVLSSEKVDKNSKVYRRIAALGVELSYPALSPYNLGQPGKDEAWPYVEGHLAELGKSLRPDAFRELRQRVAPDLWAVMSELDRLAAYVGDRRQIEAEDVETLVAESRTDVMFELVDAVGTRNLRQALQLLGRLVESGTNALAVLATLAQSVTQVREARILVDAGVGWGSQMNYSSFQRQVLPAAKRIDPHSSVLEMHPFAAFKAFQRANAFRPEELDTLLQGLADIDLKLKTTGEEGLRALQMFLVERLAQSPAAQARRSLA